MTKKLCFSNIFGMRCVCPTLCRKIQFWRIKVWWQLIWRHSGGSGWAGQRNQVVAVGGGTELCNKLKDVEATAAALLTPFNDCTCWLRSSCTPRTDKRWSITGRPQLMSVGKPCLIIARFATSGCLNRMPRTKGTRLSFTYMDSNESTHKNSAGWDSWIVPARLYKGWSEQGWGMFDSWEAS